MQPQTLELGISTTVIGLGVVFSVLIILSFSTWFLTTLVDGAIERKKARETALASVSAETSPILVEPIFAPSLTGVSAKTVAAIMAAVSLASGKPISQLHFTAIRRGSTVGTAWSTSSTADIIANRQAYL